MKRIDQMCKYLNNPQRLISELEVRQLRNCSQLQNKSLSENFFPHAVIYITHFNNFVLILNVTKKARSKKFPSYFNMPQRHFFDAYKSGAITNFKPSLSSSGNILLSQGQKQPSQMFFKIGVLKYLGKFTGKYICQSLLFN